MLLGMTRHALRDAVIMIAPGYVRGDEDSKQGWFAKIYPTRIQGVFVGYDFIEAIKVLWEKLGYEEFSVAEVFYAMEHPGAGFANTFVSHMQIEAIRDTFLALKNLAEKWLFFEPICWLDYISLRQKKHDFTFDQVEATIREIGRTAVVTAELGVPPEAVTRSFCLFEWWAALKPPAGEFIVTSMNTIGACSIRSGSYEVDCTAATTKDDDVKKEIDAKIDGDIGFEEFARKIERAIKRAERALLLESICQLLYIGFVFGTLFVIGEEIHLGQRRFTMIVVFLLLLATVGLIWKDISARNLHLARSARL